MHVTHEHITHYMCVDLSAHPFYKLLVFFSYIFLFIFNIFFWFSYGRLFLAHIAEEMTDSPTFSGDKSLSLMSFSSALYVLCSFLVLICLCS